ncbi:hypothetical protein TNCV_3158721 [Trichonephila clavipes]|nr:hypothetical protein TNCV_3158721 [Trichonephila clavipes]
MNWMAHTIRIAHDCCQKHITDQSRWDSKAWKTQAVRDSGIGLWDSKQEDLEKESEGEATESEAPKALVHERLSY